MLYVLVFDSILKCVLENSNKSIHDNKQLCVVFKLCPVLSKHNKRINKIKTVVLLKTYGTHSYNMYLY